MIVTIGAAWGAACCGGPPVDPVVLAAGERWAVSSGVVAGVTPLRWSLDGTLHEAGDARATWSLGVRTRLTPWAQFGAVLPVGVDTVRGAGLDDPTVLVRLEPDAAALGTRPRLLLFSTAPAGRRTDDMVRWWLGGATVSVEHAGSFHAAAAYATATLPLFPLEETAITPGIQFDVGAGWGPRDTWGSVIVGGGLRGTLPGRIDGVRAGAGAVAPVARLLWTAALQPNLRVVTGITAGPPIPYLGRNDGSEIAATCTVVFAPERMVPGPGPEPDAKR